MNLRIYMLSATQILLLVAFLVNLYGISDLLPPGRLLWFLAFSLSFPTITIFLLLSIYEIYRRIQLPI